MILERPTEQNSGWSCRELSVCGGEVDTIPSQGSLTQDSLVKDQKQGHINSQILSTFYSCGQSGLM